jgi:hypothetical protein
LRGLDHVAREADARALPRSERAPSRRGGEVMSDAPNEAPVRLDVDVAFVVNAPAEVREQAKAHALLVVDGARFFSRIFVVQGDEKDFMGALFKDPGGPWRFDHRFRYYRPDPKDDPFRDHDEKSGLWLVIPAQETKAGVLRFVRSVLGLAVDMGFGGDGAIHEIVLETNDPRAIKRALQRESFFHSMPA